MSEQNLAHRLAMCEAENLQLHRENKTLWTIVKMLIENKEDRP